MENSVHKISKALLDLASAADVVLHATPKARAALKATKLDSTQRSLLERIDGFRSLEQLLAMSGDLIAVHAALGKLMAAGLVATDSPVEAAIAMPASAAPPVVEKKVAAPLPAKAPPSGLENAKRLPKVPSTELENAKRIPQAPSSELDNAKHLVLIEVKMALGKGAEKLRPRIEACSSIEEIFDLIVKVREYLTTTGKANPDVFLERLTTGLATARKKSTSATCVPGQ